MRTFASLFSGVGGAEIAAARLGFKPVFGVEYAPKIAAIHVVNHNSTMLVSPVQEVNYPDVVRRMPGLNWLHASPACQSFSVVRRGWGNFPNESETEADRTAAMAVNRALEAFEPDIFTLENVRGYGKTYSFSRISLQLERLGYQVEVTSRSPVDYGIPQVRNRLFIVAVRQDALREAGELIHPAAGGEKPGWGSLLQDGEPEDWPEAKLYPSFIKAEPDIAAGRIEHPALVFGARISSTKWSRPFASEPSSTVTASQYKRRVCLIEPGGKVRLVPFEFMARIQAFPPDFDWSGHKMTDYTGLGNAICPPVLEALVKPLIARVNWK